MLSWLAASHAAAQGQRIQEIWTSAACCLQLSRMCQHRGVVVLVCRVWSSQTGRQVAVLQGHTGRGMWRCALAGPHLITGGADGSIKSWRWASHLHDGPGRCGRRCPWMRPHSAQSALSDTLLLIDTEKILIIENPHLVMFKDDRNLVAVEHLAHAFRGMFCAVDHKTHTHHAMFKGTEHAPECMFQSLVLSPWEKPA